MYVAFLWQTNFHLHSVSHVSLNRNNTALDFTGPRSTREMKLKCIPYIVYIRANSQKQTAYKKQSCFN
jgi:hypothetical protein